MLVLRRYPGEKIKLSNGIVFTVVKQECGRVVIGIDAPKHIGVTRSKPCVICKKPTFDYYLGYKDVPFCGSEECAERIRAGEEEGKQ